MSTKRGLGGRTDLSDALSEFLGTAARFVLWAGIVSSALCVLLLVFTYFKAGSGASKADIASAISNVDIGAKVLNVGIPALAVGACYLFWGEDIFAVIMLLVAAALFFAPMYFPSMLGDPNNDAQRSALAALQLGGAILGVISVFAILIDIIGKVRDRAKFGAKSDAMKYGKGIKEEDDKQNVLLGKCWQLPFCRKFVREKCPIYHARTSCWRHLTGCMCEESVIRSAMENKPIGKDQLMSASYIPVNNKLTTAQKKERCHQCVIYNEHQRHKYKVAMPSVLIGFVLIYFAFHGPLHTLVYGLCKALNQIVQKGSLNTATIVDPPGYFVEGLIFVLLLIGLSYAMKTLEFLIFKLKV